MTLAQRILRLRLAADYDLRRGSQLLAARRR
jgi:hypothetical protein